MTTDSWVADHLDLDLPEGVTVLVYSDLHLTARTDPVSERTAGLIGRRLRECEGPACLVLNGDVLDFWAEPEMMIETVLDVHAELGESIAAFAAVPGHQVVLVVGNHDTRLAWDDPVAKSVATRWHCRCTLTLDLTLRTAAGDRRVRVEHGHRFDPLNAVRDPRNPLDRPAGQHIVEHVLRRDPTSAVLRDLGDLADASAVPRFTSSRLVYRQVVRHSWWLAVPLLLSLSLRAPLVVRAFARSDDLSRLPALLPLALAAAVVDVVGVVVAVALLVRSVGAALALPLAGPADRNAAAREAAADLINDPADPGDPKAPVALVTSHTHTPELTPLGPGFYANTGCCKRVVVEEPARLHLPPVFRPVQRVTWLELTTEHDVRAALMAAETDLRELTRPERLAIRPARPLGTDGEPLAVLPGSAGFPLASTGLSDRRREDRVRGQAALLVSFVALLTLASALTSPLQGRLRWLLDVLPLPLEVPQTAACSAAFVSVGLLLLARGLRRGLRLSWGPAVALLALSAGLNLLKGVDVEEAVVATVAAVWLARRRRAFPVPTRLRHLHPVAGVVLGLGVALGSSVVAVVVAGSHRMLSVDDEAIAERLVGNSSLPLTRTDSFVTPVLLTAGFAVLLACGFVLTALRRRGPLSAAAHLADRERAREVVTRCGADSLAYFALRDDKEWFFSEDCVVAYSLRDGVCLVSPDPVGPASQWVAAWRDFLAFADGHGWPVAVVGASEGWLPVYVATGMRSMYMGDEAIVDCQEFSLDGRPRKQLRSAARRVERAGYAVTFHDPATLDDGARAELAGILEQSRRGRVERGFSMTLSRAFDPADAGLLLAVARDGEGRAAGFCQWVPAPGIAGWSLDLMRRRDDDELPNGLTDYIILRTIEHLRENGFHGLSLNFAVMRGVLAGEQGSGPFVDFERRVMTRFSDTMQIASLWHYNEKFGPAWIPRYIVLGRLTSAAAQTLAIADAEGVTELPFVGRFLGRHNRRPADRGEVQAG